MDISLESTGDIARKMTVTVPAEELTARIDKRLKELSRTVKLPGFRPGKVPRKVVESRFSAQALSEAAEDLIGSSYREALTEKEIVPAGAPKIEPKSIERGADLEYIATFDVFPEVSALDIEGVTIDRPTCEITSADIDRTIETLQKRQTTFEPDTDRAAEEGDRLTIDFNGELNGEAFDGGSATGYPIILGSGSFVDGFEDALFGKTAGSDTSFDVTFPDDYPGAVVAGQKVDFHVTVKEVAKPVIPEIDEAFIQGFGVSAGTLDAFRDEVKNNLQRELDDRIRSSVRGQVLENLLERNEIEVPSQLVEEEIDRAVHLTRQQLERQGLPADRSIDRGRFEEEARRRVALGLILHEVIKKRDIQADPETVRSRIEEMAASYDEPEQFVRWYYSDKARLAQVEAVVVEDQVVEELLKDAKIVEKPTDFQDFVNASGADSQSSGG